MSRGWAIALGFLAGFALLETAGPLIATLLATVRARIPNWAGSCTVAVLWADAILVGVALTRFLSRKSASSALAWAAGLTATVALIIVGSVATNQSTIPVPSSAGTLATASAVTGWRQFKPKSDFRPGDRVWVYTEALNINRAGRANVDFEFQVWERGRSAPIYDRKARYATVTSEPSCWESWHFQLPDSARPGTYDVRVSIRDNLTGQLASAATTLTVLAPTQVTVPTSTTKVPPNTVIMDEFNGSCVGETYGITYVTAPGGEGALFVREAASRIEYRNGIPPQGTLEWWINVTSGYWYGDFQLSANQPQAMIFATDVQGGDVTWPGTTKLFVYKNGDVSLWVATSMYNRPPAQSVEAKATAFSFNQWHAIGISYGSEGEYIMVDGTLVASAPEKTQTLGAAGNHQTPLDVPTIGETVSSFWARHRYEGGFEGILRRFRASTAQRDWYLARGIGD